MEYFDQLSALFEGEDADLFKSKRIHSVSDSNKQLVESFEKITAFARSFGRAPEVSSDDLSEAVLGTQLNTIRFDREKSNILQPYDELELLKLDKAPETLDELFSSDSFLFSNEEDLFDIAKIPESKRVVKYGGDVAQRDPIENFENTYKKQFLEQQALLASGDRKLTPFHSIDQLQLNQYYVYDGMMCFVKDFGQKERKTGGYTQQRILVLFENGTKSNMYKRSLAQRLYEGGSVVVNFDYAGFSDGDQAVGRIYVLSSLSNDPKVKMVKDLHKIGVTKGNVSERIKNAANDPTYLMAPVKLLEDYRLTGDYNPKKVEAFIHKLFRDAKVDLEIIDRNGVSYVPSEWYSVPHAVIVEAIDRLAKGEILNCYYDKDLQEIIQD